MADGAWQTIGARALLELREVLIRHDEGAKALMLMEECVPYVCQSRRDVQQATADTRQMYMHLQGSDEMRDYYKANPHDQPFEKQYGLGDAKEALRIPRFNLLQANLPVARADRSVRMLDLACNDGILGAALVESGRSDVLYDGVDLDERCIERAKERDEALRGLGGLGRFACCDLHQASITFEPGSYDVVCLFEVIEHALDPVAAVAAAWAMVKPGGHLWMSTPCGAMEAGELPNWDRVERKGHVRALLAPQFADLFPDSAVECAMWTCSDRTLVAQARKPEQR